MPSKVDVLKMRKKLTNQGFSAVDMDNDVYCKSSDGEMEPTVSDIEFLDDEQDTDESEEEGVEEEESGEDTDEDYRPFQTQAVQRSPPSRASPDGGGCSVENGSKTPKNTKKRTVESAKKVYSQHKNEEGKRQSKKRQLSFTLHEKEEGEIPEPSHKRARPVPIINVKKHAASAKRTSVGKKFKNRDDSNQQTMSFTDKAALDKKELAAAKRRIVSLRKEEENLRQRHESLVKEEQMYNAAIVAQNKLLTKKKNKPALLSKEFVLDSGSEGDEPDKADCSQATHPIQHRPPVVAASAVRTVSTKPVQMSNVAYAPSAVRESLLKPYEPTSTAENLLLPFVLPPEEDSTVPEYTNEVFELEPRLSLHAGFAYNETFKKEFENIIFTRYPKTTQGKIFRFTIPIDCAPRVIAALTQIFSL